MYQVVDPMRVRREHAKMADKWNPFRERLTDALRVRGLARVCGFGSGRHADLYTCQDRWLALIVQKCLSDKPWWNIPHYFEQLRSVQRKHPGYLVVEVFQDDEAAGTVTTGDDLELLYTAGADSADRFGNVKVLPDHLHDGLYLRGAEPMTNMIAALLGELPPEPGAAAVDLIPEALRRPPRRRKGYIIFEEDTVVPRF